MSSTPAPERCEVCGQSNSSTLEEHHIVPRRFGGSDNPENLAKLCGGCHNAIERIYDDSFYERLQTLPKREIEFEPRDSVGVEASPWEAPSRQFPDSAMHVKMVSMPPYRQAELGILDEEVVERVAATDRIDQLRRKVEELKDELEAEDELDQELETEMDFEYEVDFEGSVDVPVLFEQPPTEPDPVNANSVVDQLTVKEEIERYEETISNVEADFEADEIIEVKSEYTQVISCGYCNKVFAEYQPAAAARHLQLAHHIDNPYDVVGMSDDEKERIKDRLRIENDPLQSWMSSSRNPGGGI